MEIWREPPWAETLATARDKVDRASGSLLSDSRGEIPGDLIIEGAQL